MRIKSIVSLLILVFLTGLMIGLISFPASAEGNHGNIIQISPSGQGWVHAVAYSPNGKVIAVGSSLGIHLFNSSDLQLLWFTATDTWVRALAFSPDGSMLASGSYDSNIRLWRTSDGTLLKELTGNSACVRSLAFSPDGGWLATASDDNTVRLWNMPDGNLRRIFDKNMEGLRTLAISPDGTILATGGFDKIIRLWNTSDGTLVRALEGHTDWVRTLAFSPDGESLASGAFDATVRLWRVSDGELLVTRKEHSSSVLSLVFSPDGSLLASGSVDTTVRLWKMPTLEPYDLLRGHTDFVYSVAFSPDGKSLISGAIDNTIRSWNVREQENPAAKELVSTPSNCKVCHHPLGNFPQPGGYSLPPRVLDVGCTSCHLGGTLVLNWCPAFPRSPNAHAGLAVSPAASDKIGVPRGNQELSVVISTPGNREYFLMPNVIAPLPIAGQVYYARGDNTDIEIQLEVWSGSEKIATLNTRPQSNGYFYFNTFLGKHDTQIKMPIEQRICSTCHNENVDGKILIPSGEIHILITAETLNGNQAFDERWINVDQSRSDEVAVQVILEDKGQPVSGLNVQASTTLYDWRERTFTGITDANGIAYIPLEVLSEASTHYTFQVPSTLINGVLYESIKPVNITLLPGATTTSAITLHVQSVHGEISGQVIGLDPPVQVRAISLPDGATRIITTSHQNTFAFTDLPIGDYLVVLDTQELAEQGLVLSSERIDLSHQISAHVEMFPKQLEGGSLTGTITDETGVSLPFAWMSIESQITQTDPASGSYAFFGLSANETTATLSAPGYYSQAQYLDLPNAASTMSISLVRRPETLLLPWGDGTVIIPPETVSRVQGQMITFEQGWLWGRGESQEPLVILWENMQITIPGGEFALERLPAHLGWLYVLAGEASIQQGDTTSTVVIKSGEMISLNPDQTPHPLAYDPVTIHALSADEMLPFTPIWQPSLSANIRDRLAGAGISTAQFMTFVTYLMALLTLLAMPTLIVKWMLKNKQERKHD